MAKETETTAPEGSLEQVELQSVPRAGERDDSQQHAAQGEQGQLNAKDKSAQADMAGEPRRRNARGARRSSGGPAHSRKAKPSGRVRRPARSRYVPALDGLRAFAVLAVILYHMSLGWAPGGLMGVTVFFVISGYLINGLLVSEHERTGRISLSQFWLRRVRRIVPAVLLAIAGTVALCALMSPSLLEKARSDIAPSLLFFNNWWQIFHEVSYFEAAGAPSPLTHYWSLAIEEQFYIVWPLLLIGMFAIGLKKKHVGGIALVLAVLSAVEMALLYDPHGDPSRVYYGTDTRAMSLLVGVWLAIAWPSAAFGLRRANNASRSTWIAFNVAGVASLLGLVAIIVFTSGYSAFPYYGGIALTSVLSAVVIAVLVVPDTWIARLLQLSPFVWIGKRSYGMYLWHYPIILLTSKLGSAVEVPWWARVAQLIVIFAISDLSYRFVEDPIRKGRLGNWWRNRKAHQKVPVLVHVRRFATCTTVAAVLVGAVVGCVIVVPDSGGKAKGDLVASTASRVHAEARNATTNPQVAGGNAQQGEASGLAGGSVAASSAPAVGASDSNTMSSDARSADSATATASTASSQASPSASPAAVSSEAGQSAASASAQPANSSAASNSASAQAASSGSDSASASSQSASSGAASASASPQSASSASASPQSASSASASSQSASSASASSQGTPNSAASSSSTQSASSAAAAPDSAGTAAAVPTAADSSAAAQAVQAAGSSEASASASAETASSGASAQAEAGSDASSEADSFISQVVDKAAEEMASQTLIGDTVAKVQEEVFENAPLKRVVKTVKKEKKAEEKRIVSEAYAEAIETPHVNSDGKQLFAPLLIGDSVSAGCVDEFYRVFPNGCIDAVVNRNMWESPYQLYADAGQVGDYVVFCLGTNNALVDWQVDEMLAPVSEDKKIILVNIRAPRDWESQTNKELAAAAERHPNVVALVDWYSASAGHDEYFYDDGIHLTNNGPEAYIGLIQDAIEESIAKDALAKVVAGR